MSGTQKRLRTAGGLEYALMGGYPHGSVAKDGTATATEVYRINASDLDAFIEEILAPPVQDGDTLQFAAPRGLPGASYFLPQNLAWKPFNDERPIDPFGADAEAQEGTYEDEIELTIEYQTELLSGEHGAQTQTDDPDTFLEKSINITFEHLALTSNKDVKTEKGSGSQEIIKTPIPPFIKLIPMAEVTLTWPRSPNPDFTSIFELLGTVNLLTVEWLFNAPLETALFLGVAGKQSYVWHGRGFIYKPWHLDFKFALKNVVEAGVNHGWNHIYNPDTHKFERVIRIHDDGDTSYLYQRADWTDMFKPYAYPPVILT
jgi:hypothetical protein